MTGSTTGNSTGLCGISVNTGNTVVNQGTIAVSGTNSVGFLAQGDNSNFVNSGALGASGTGSYAAKFTGNGNALVNSGMISGDILFDGDNNIFTNSGTYTARPPSVAAHSKSSASSARRPLLTLAAF